MTGQFDTVEAPCKMATLWNFRKNAWVCLLRRQDLFTKISAAYKDPDGNALYLAGKVNPRSAHAASLGEGKRWSVVELDISAYADPDHDQDHDHGSGSGSGRVTAGGRGAPGRGQHLASGGGVDLLSGFAGTDGPIEVLMLGKGELSGTLLVAGKFVTDSSVLFLPTQREHGGDGGGGGGDDDRSRGSTGDKGTVANGGHDDDSSPGTLHHPPGHSEDSIQETVRVAVGLGRRRTRSSGGDGDGDGDDDTHSSSHSSWETDTVEDDQTLNGTVMALARVWIPSRKAGFGHAWVRVRPRTMRM